MTRDDLSVNSAARRRRDPTLQGREVRRAPDRATSASPARRAESPTPEGRTFGTDAESRRGSGGRSRFGKFVVRYMP